MTGYDKSPDYGGPQPGRWTLAIWLIAVVAGAATVWVVFG